MLSFMENRIIQKEYFGRNYSFFQINIDELCKSDINFFNNNQANGIIIVSHLNGIINDLSFVTKLKELKAINLNMNIYENLSALQKLEQLEYISFYGKAKNKIPFSSLPKLWTVYLNYEKETCSSIFKCGNIENIFIDNYSGKNSLEFETFINARRIGLMKNQLSEFDAIRCMPKLEHLGIGYNNKMCTIEWLKGNSSLSSIAFQNCKKITNWEILASLKNIESISLENCGEIDSLDFISNIISLKELRIIGSTYIRDCKIRKLLDLSNLQYLLIPIKKGYDITLDDLYYFNMENS